jgi:hypothetical protein
VSKQRMSDSLSLARSVTQIVPPRLITTSKQPSNPDGSLPMELPDLRPLPRVISPSTWEAERLTFYW